MDVIVEFHDKYLLTPYVYPINWTEDSKIRQFVSIYLITVIFAYVSYFLMTGLNYFFFYDKKLLEHPLFRKHQIRKEISISMRAVPMMTLLVVICLFLEIHFGKLHDFKQDEGWFSLTISTLYFVIFTDFFTYWIHRWLHLPSIYKHIHQTHHQFKISTPFSAYAFHPFDGFIQAFPSHLYVFLFPMNKYLFLFMFLISNIWVVSIHDSEYKVPEFLKSIINGSAHHTDHHYYYNYNYGQYFTFTDKLFGTWKQPSVYSENSPMENFNLKTCNS